MPPRVTMNKVITGNQLPHARPAALGWNSRNNDDLLKTSILSHPPNTQCPPKGSLASCTTIANFPHTVCPWAMVPSGIVYAWGGQMAILWCPQRTTKQWMAMLLSAERILITRRNNSRTFTLGSFFIFLPNFWFWEVGACRNQTAHPTVWILKIRSLHRPCPRCRMKMNAGVQMNGLEDSAILRFIKCHIARC